MSDKHNATYHGGYQCADCATYWPSRAAADECQLLDAIEARDARRPSTRTIRTVQRWDND